MLNSIGKNLREYRLKKSMRQEDLAEKVGLSTNYIGMIERGEKIPSFESFLAIVNALEISADKILVDVLNVGYEIKESMLSEKLSDIPIGEREKIYIVIDTLITLFGQKWKAKYKGLIYKKARLNLAFYEFIKQYFILIFYKILAIVLPMKKMIFFHANDTF